MKRGLGFYFTKLRKTTRTLYYLVNISWSLRNPKIGLGIFRSFVFGHSRDWARHPALQVTHGLIWARPWLEWHERNWSMKPVRGWTILGNPDVQKFRLVNIGSNKIIYYYQTLVEDGRIKYELMDAFYSILSQVSIELGKVVHVKWHPRGDPAIRACLENLGLRIHDDLPVGKNCHVVGHYSSLMGISPIMGNCVIAFKLKAHEIPKSIFQISNHIVDDRDGLLSALVLCDESTRRLKRRGNISGTRTQEKLSWE